MHFWINKGNQGRYWPRPYPVPYRVVRPPPEAVANYLARHQIIRPRGLHPKPMVTPVRRFQSLESVANNGLRYGRSSPSHRPNRPNVHNNAHVAYNNAANARIPRTDRERSIDIDNDQASPQTVENNELESYIRKFKFAMLAFALFSVCAMVGANYLSTGQLWRIGLETLVIVSVALVVLLLGGIIILYLDERQNANVAMVRRQNVESSNDQLQLDDLQERPEPQRPTHLPIQQSEILEMSPPPYHIAIMLSSNQHDLEEIQIYDDQSPPPPYEKVVSSK